MPSTPILVNGNITDSSGSNANKALIKFYGSTDTEIYKTSTDGKYLVDLQNIDISIGDVITYKVFSQFNNEYYTSTFIATSNQTINPSLSIRTSALTVPGNRDTQIYNLGAEPVSTTNPFPVINKELPDNYDTVWVITRGDGQPDSETITLGSDSYKRTFSYTGDILTGRTRWVKQ